MKLLPIKIIIAIAILCLGAAGSYAAYFVAYNNWTKGINEDLVKSQQAYTDKIGKSTDTYALVKNGKRLMENKMLDFANTNLTRATEIDANYRDAWVCLGYTALKMNNTSRALEALKKAESLDPIYATTYELLNLAYKQNKDPDSAQKAQEKFEFLTKK